MAGWVHRRRDHGGLIFIDLRDRTGLLQLVFRPERRSEAHALAQALRSEDVISVERPLELRSQETINPQMATGEVELSVTSIDQLADADTPPFEIESFSGEVGEETRLRYRYIDLRRDEMREALELRDAVVKTMRAHLDERGFLDIETPILTRSTPEGARDYLVPSRLQPGNWYALPQSPQLFKQLLMMGGLERYYQIARCFRDEDLRADRQPEFTQLDIEMSFVEEEDVIALVRRPDAGGARRRGGRGQPADRAAAPTTDAMLRYGSGSARPADRHGDRRISAMSSLASEFKVFSGAIGDGGVVRGFCTARGEFPRRSGSTS